MKQTTLDLTLLPEAWINWATTKGVFWLECKTGKKQTEKPDGVTFRYYANNNAALCISGNARQPIFAYVKYHEDIEMLEIAAATIPTNKKEEVHEWTYAGEKYFIGKDKTVYDENGNVKSTTFHLYTNYYAQDFRRCLAHLYRLPSHGGVIKEFHKFLGSETYTVGSGRIAKANALWNIQEWYITKQKVKGKGREQKLVDKLTAIPLSDFAWISEKYPVKEISEPRYGYSYYKRYVTGIVYFERVDDEWSVLRIFHRNRDGSDIREVERFYLSDNGGNRICSPSNNGWVTSKNNKSEWGQQYIVVNKDEAMEKCKRLKYIMPLFDDNHEHIKRYLINALRFPEIEQMMKLGHNQFAKVIAKSDTPRADMLHAFGEYYNEKEKNLLRKVGLTKHQFDEYMSVSLSQSYNYINNNSKRSLAEMRKFFGDDFIHLDNDTFDEYFNAFITMNQYAYSGFQRYIDLYDLDYKKFMKMIVRIGKKNNDVYGMIRDTMSMYQCLDHGTHPEIDWYFESYSDVVRAHDAIMEIKRIQDEERRAMYNMKEAERRKKEEEKRKKLDEERQKYNYEDDEYIIRLPKDGNEIVAEGSKQRICIGGYVGSHSTGQTNLFFLRKKSEPDKPFYAIEMRSNVINQIHGFGNRWLGCNPEAIPTVIRWLRKHNIKCTDHILTCTATGYGGSAGHCAMPVVD